MMKKDGIKPNIITYNLILASLMKYHKTSEFLLWLADMTQDGIEWDRITFNQVIRYHSLHGKADKILEVVGMMENGWNHFN